MYIIGIDLGIKKLLTLSDGTTYDNNKYIDKYEKRIKKLQRELSRKEQNFLMLKTSTVATIGI